MQNMILFLCFALEEEEGKERWVRVSLTSDGNKGDDEVRRISGDQVRECCREYVGPVPDCAAALVYQF